MVNSCEISIVMPVRNAASTLPAALDSIRGQDFPHWELLAVDDGSEDETAFLLHAAAGADSRIRVCSQAALGIAAALRHGCAMARGGFIARMDADDWMPPERLRRQVEFFAAHPQIGVVSCRVRHGGDEKAQAGYAAHVAWINSLLTPEAMAMRRFVESPVAHPSVIFRRELLERYGGYAGGDFPEDYELWLRWMEAGVRFGKVDEELLVWNDRPARLSRTDARYRTEAFYRMKTGYLARWLRDEVDAAREIWLWGAGRITGRRFRGLESEGVSISGFVDVDPNKMGRRRDGRLVVGPENLPPRRQSFILAAVSARGARDLIAEKLNSAGWREGRDYLLAG
jgi:glycosyltransferase involved in cell wall biosynthesis